MTDQRTICRMVQDRTRHGELPPPLLLPLLPPPIKTVVLVMVVVMVMVTGTVMGMFSSSLPTVSEAAPSVSIFIELQSYGVIDLLNGATF